jgi:hypothetical protein
MLVIAVFAVAYAKFSMDGIEERLTRIEKETFKNFSVNVSERLDRIEKETFKNFSVSVSKRLDSINHPIEELIRQGKEDNRRQIMFERIFVDVINYFLIMSTENINRDIRANMREQIKARLKLLDLDIAEKRRKRESGGFP